MVRSAPSVVLVDLNNFARYPTLSVGYLVALLRSAGFEMQVLSPLAVGVGGVRRERRAPWWGLLEQRIRHATVDSRLAGVRGIRAALSAWRWRMGVRGSRAVARELHAVLAEADALLVSTYSTHRSTCALLGETARLREVPMLVGGPGFTHGPVVADWVRLPGIAAVVGGEVEDSVVELAAALCEGRSLRGMSGVTVPGEPPAPPRPPLRRLDALPWPDFSDFPWDRYPNRIVPVLTGRGCAWGACDFCSDVLTSSGRRFRSRSSGSVLDELEAQSLRYESSSFVFTDLKLNSDLGMWRGLLEGLQARVPGARWIGAVHVGADDRNGLSRSELKSARQAGMVRITTGLESGSQRVLDAMAKGTDLERNSAFVREAWEAGISVRATMIVGHPAEEPDDVAASADFVHRHAPYLDRVSLNRLHVYPGTPLQRRLDGSRGPSAPGFTRSRPGRHQRRALLELLREVHDINRRKLPLTVREFDGVM